jgi:hypothetical protein
MGTGAGLFGDNCYMAFTEAVTWADAASTCDLLDSHLATVSSSEENAFVQTLVTSPNWLGLTDQWGESIFIWYEGPGDILSLTYTSWDEGNSQPDNDPNANGDCAIMSLDGLWSDEECTAVFYYICEHEWN